MLTPLREFAHIASGDLPDAGGDYECDLQLTDPAGLVETYYSKIRIKTRAEIVP